MSKEYYTIEKRNNLGELNIGVSVFQSIVVHTVSEIDGIDFDGGKKNSVEVSINDNNQVSIEVEIVIDYGKNVSKLVGIVQSEAVNAIKNMVGFRTVKVDVNVTKIKF
ncbi:MAG: Asp23/Gls24 family envelope stress response protein [Faecalibacillus sp.]